MEYQCPDCHYIYNEEAGDPDNGVSLGTKFEDLPASWVCPICGSEKTDFEHQESPQAASLDYKIASRFSSTKCGGRLITLVLYIS